MTPVVTLTCGGCEEEMPRHMLARHSLTCAGGCARECPFGCGEMVTGGAEGMAQHRSECLLEPRKLLAALGHLQSENARLTHENLALRQAEVRTATALHFLCAHRTRTLPSATQLRDDPLRVRALQGEPSQQPTTPMTKKRRTNRGPGLCIE